MSISLQLSKPVSHESNGVGRLGEQRLLIGHERQRLRGRGLEGLLSRRDGKLGALGLGHGRRLRGSSRAGAAAANHLLHLASVLAGVLLANSGQVAHLLLGDATDLGGLRADGIRGRLELGVDELLVRGIDERNGESNDSADDGETPVRDQLDEVVREEGRDASLLRSERG